jgi:hypothetical protein
MLRVRNQAKQVVHYESPISISFSEEQPIGNIGLRARK